MEKSHKQGKDEGLSESCDFSLGLKVSVLTHGFEYVTEKYRNTNKFYVHGLVYIYISHLSAGKPRSSDFSNNENA